MHSQESRILILCKTYPSPSSKYSETSCVAGIDDAGRLIRPFPVPFRLIKDEKQFKKWQWIKARVGKATRDHRPESHKLLVDTIKFDGDPLPTKNNWMARRDQLKDVPIFGDFDALEAERQNSGITLGLLRPIEILELQITPVDNPNWTEDEAAKLVQHQNQAGMFDDSDAPAFRTLRKLPFDFHYHYRCGTGDAARDYRHKISDWEAGALYWNCRARYGQKWEQPFREKLGVTLPSADLIFLMGTIHRFPDKWLIVSLIYPPKSQPEEQRQASLFDL